MELVTKWFPAGKFRRFDTNFRIDSTYENYLLSTLPLTVNALHNTKMEYHGKFGHNFVRIQHIYIMSRIDICYTSFRMATQNVAPMIPGFQSIKRCIQYMASHPHKTIFYPSNSYNGLNFIRLT